MTNPSIPKTNASHNTLDRLFSHLWQGGNKAYYCTFAPNRSRWFDVGSHPNPSGRNVYFGIHPVDEIPPTNAKNKPTAPTGVRSQIKYISAINVLFAEFDAKDFDGNAANHVAGLPIAPSVVIESSPGSLHCYWLLDETYLLKNVARRERAQRIQSQWVDFVGGDKAAKDLARVLRIPGTTNFAPKKRDGEHPVKFLSADFTLVYDLEVLAAAAAVGIAQRAPTLPTVKASTVEVANGDGEFHDAYVAAAVNGELDILARTGEGGRNAQLNKSAYALGQLVGAGVLDESTAADKLLTVALAIGLSEREAAATIASGLTAGIQNPRNLPKRRNESRSDGNGDGGPTVRELLTLCWQSAKSPDFAEKMNQTDGAYRTANTDRKTYHALLRVAMLAGCMEFTAGIARLRDYAAMGGKSTVRRSIERLVTAGYVEIVADFDKETSTATRYRIVDPLRTGTGGYTNELMASIPVPFEQGSDYYSKHVSSDAFMTGTSRSAKRLGNTERGLGETMLLVISTVSAHGSMSRRTIASLTGASMSAIATATRRAESLGLLATEEGLRGAKIYELPEGDVWESVATLTPSLRTVNLRAERLERDAAQSQFWVERAIKDFTQPEKMAEMTEWRDRLRAKRRDNLRIIHPDWTAAAIEMWVNPPGGSQHKRWHITSKLEHESQIDRSFVIDEDEQEILLNLDAYRDAAVSVEVTL